MTRSRFPDALDILLWDRPYLSLCQRQHLAGGPAGSLLQSRIEFVKMGAEARALWLQHDEWDGLLLDLCQDRDWAHQEAAKGRHRANDPHVSHGNQMSS